MSDSKNTAVSTGTEQTLFNPPLSAHGGMVGQGKGTFTLRHAIWAESQEAFEAKRKLTAGTTDSGETE